VAAGIISFNASSGQLDFSLDLAASAQLATPFNLDIGDIASFVPGPLADIANALVGLGASGNLALSASGTLQLSLGLDLSGPVTITTTTSGSASPPTAEVQTLVVDATGGAYDLWFDANKNGDHDSGETVTGIAWNAPVSVGTGNVQDKLRTLNTLGGTTNVSVSGTVGSYTITFAGSLGNVATLAAENVDGLTGDQKASFLKVGDTGTKLVLDASAAAT